MGEGGGQAVVGIALLKHLTAGAFAGVADGMCSI